MAETAVETIVRRMVGHFAPEPTALADPDALLLDDLGYSSLRLLELAFTLEDLFSMDPATMGEAPPVGTVGELVAFLDERVAEGAASVPPMENVDEALAAI